MASDVTYVDLQSMGTTIASGDAYLADHRWENAVQAYQAAGSQVASLKAELNPSSLVDQAGALNNQLQSLRWQLASQATADQAADLAKRIQGLLGQAYASTGAITIPGGPLAPGVAPGVVSAPIDWGRWILGGAIAAGIGAMFYLMIRGPEALEPRHNPVGGLGSNRGRHRGKSLVAKGHSCLFELEDGRDIKTAGGMLHDPTGKAWPKHSVLVGRFRGNLRRAQGSEVSRAARSYLGDDHRVSIGNINTPPKPLAGWQRYGKVERIYYTRTGSKFVTRTDGRRRFQHGFGEWHLVNLFRGRGSATLYRRDRYWRLELPRNAVLDERGFVFP